MLSEWRKWLRHAFGERSSVSEGLSPEDELLVDQFCKQIVQRRLTTPAILWLSSCEPLARLTGQGLYWLKPLVAFPGYEEVLVSVARYLERPGGVEYLCRRIEELDLAESESTQFQPSCVESISVDLSQADYVKEIRGQS